MLELARRGKATTGFLVFAVASAGATSVVAAQTPSEPPVPGDGSAATPSPETAELSAEVIDEYTVEAATASGLAAERVQQYLDEQARSGNPQDIASLQYAAVPVGPNNEGEIAAVMSATENLANMGTYLIEGDEPVAGLSLGFEPSSEDGAPIASASPGYDAASGLTPFRRNCRDIYFEWHPASSTGQIHHIYDCWEKFRFDNKNWAYNRYTLFDPAENGSNDTLFLNDATIYSKPWSGLEKRVTGGPFQYAPKPSQNCNTGSASITVGAASLSIPLVQCSSSLEIYPNNFGPHSFGVDWDGSNNGQVFLDEAFQFNGNGEEPKYADRLYMGVVNCGTSHLCWLSDDDEYYQWKESGW